MIIDQLPQHYKSSQIIKCLSLAIENEKQLFNKYFEDTKREYFINTALTSIYDWEREFKVPSYIHQDINTRRGNVLGRLRGYGTSNKDFIKKVVEGFYKGEEVEIIEDHSQSELTIYFKTIKDFPANYLELQRSLEELLPCHLEYSYEFGFALSNYTHAELEHYQHRVLEGAIHGGNV